MLTADEAYAKHIEMWKAMQEKLGDNPTGDERERFKRAWCEEHGESIFNGCYLCEYNIGTSNTHCGMSCVVDWGTVAGEYGLKQGGCMHGRTRYRTAPISEILALPRNEVSES